MTRLIPGRDAPPDESALVTEQFRFAGALARALDPIREDVRRVPVRALLSATGAQEPEGLSPATNLGAPLTSAEHVALVCPLRPDTPDRVPVRPIGSGAPQPALGPVLAPAARLAPEPTDPAQVAALAERTGLAESSGPSESSGPTESSGPAEPPGLVEPSCPAGPFGLAEPSGHADRAGPAAGLPARSDAAEITSALWADYLQTRAAPARDRLVLHYRALVRAVAGKLAGGLPAHVEAADLVQVGMFGLIDAVERFEPAREVRFESFAAQRIRGAMLDELRAQDWVPRTVRARRREIERVRDGLEVRLGRSAADPELAAELGVGLRELRAATHHRQLVSVEAWEEARSGLGGSAPVGGIAELLADETATDPVERLERHEAVHELVVAVAALEERDREVVRLYYLENLTLAEIGGLLGVTESRVCQLHARLLSRLRTRLGEVEAG